LSVEEARNGDRVVWCFGGAVRKDQNVLWVLDPEIHPHLMQRGFVPEDCAGDQLAIQDDVFRIALPIKPEHDQPSWVVAGKCDAKGRLFKADAKAWENPLQLLQSQAGDHPIACGEIPLRAGDYTFHWLVRSGPKPPALLEEWLARPMEVFHKNLERVQRRAQEITVDTPDKRLNVAAPVITAALDGSWYPPVFVHGSMSWNVPFPGWRTIYGPTALGWHERVLQEGQYYMAAQTKESDKTGFKANPQWGLTVQDSSSRYYGKGRIQKDQHFYNFQEVFFDQMIHACRWTGNKELAAMLRPALELHLDYMRDCFDADGNGVYESYINVWASDSVWYNGGETTQSTAYACNGHRAAAELAELAGDEDAAKRHGQRAEQIREAMKKCLWIEKKGHLGEYRETAGHKRLHEDACLYTIFLPIDAGMLDPFEAASTLYFTEWGLEREPMAAGGERCWQSNWVPYVWSVRELSIAESCHLAMAYYQAGIGQEAWKLVEGSFAESMFNSPVPGGIQVAGGGTDFNGASSMLARVIVEGLFGYRPNRQRGVVHCRPQFPDEWDHASIRTNDFSLSYKEDGHTLSLELQLSEPAEIELTLPVCGKIVEKVMLNGEASKFQTKPGFGRPLLTLQTDETAYVSVEVETAEALPPCPARNVEGIAGEQVTLTPAAGQIVRYRDPTRALDEVAITNGQLHGQLSDNTGHHLVFGQVQVGKVSYWQMYKLHIQKSVELPTSELVVRDAPPNADWYCLNVEGKFNGDVRDIFKQEYRSPRPETCSVQIGIDGYSPWTFYPWGRKPPEIDLSHVAELTGEDGRLHTPQGIPFCRPEGKRNIAFTSLWDNWPDKVSIPIKKSGEAIWLLVAGSTNHMQTKIANGIILLCYADGEIETLELINPDNYWSLEAAYDYKRNGFCLPETPPAAVMLGNHCRAMIYGRKLRGGEKLARVELETLSQEVVIGLMGVSLMNPGQ